MFRLFSSFLLTILLAAAAPVSAAEDNFQLWLNPSVTFDLDDDTGVEIETSMRFRSAEDGPDTYYARLWLFQTLSPNFTIGGAVERRINDGANDETRLLQQIAAKSGVLRARVRLEQRFVDDAGQTGWRIRTRLGVNVPLGSDDRWALIADAEPFFTLRPTSSGGQKGLTTFRTQVGVNYAATERLELGLIYLRNQDVRDGRQDRVSHVPLLTAELAF